MVVRNIAIRRITVDGCYVHEFEISVFEPGGSKFDPCDKYFDLGDDIDRVTQMSQLSTKQSRFIAADSAKGLKEGIHFWQLAASRDHPVSRGFVRRIPGDRWRKHGRLNADKHCFILWFPRCFGMRGQTSH
jgi:hypothetical protein